MQHLVVVVINLQQYKKIRNFPMLGDIFIDILTNCFQSGMSTDLEEACKKEPSFAGFWFEKSFFTLQATSNKYLYYPQE